MVTLRAKFAALASAVILLSAFEGAHAQAPNYATIERLATLRDLEGLSIAPNGELAAFQVRQARPSTNDYELAWYVAPTNDEGEARRVADGGEPMLQASRAIKINGNIAATAPAWSPDSRSIAYLRRDNGQVQVWRTNIADGRSERLTFFDSDARALVYSTDGGRILVETETSRRQFEQAFAEEGRSGFLFDRRFFPAYEQSHPVFPVDLVVGGGSAEEGRARRIWVVNTATLEVTRGGAREREEFSLLHPGLMLNGRPRTHALASSGGSLAWTEARDPSRQGGYPPLSLVVRFAGANEDVVCPAPECIGQRLGEMWWRSDRELIFLRHEGPTLSENALYSWRIGERPRRILRTFDRFSTPFEWPCAIALDRLICFHETSAQPTRLIALDLDTGSIQTLYDPNPDWQDLDLGQAPRRIEIAPGTDFHTYGYLVLPPHHRARGRLPLVIVTYRCSGFLRGGTGDEYPIYPMAARGFAVLCFNIPTEDYDRLARVNWTDYAAWARGEGDPIQERIIDALSAVLTQLDREGIIDRDRVGVTGLSYGSEVVGFAISRLPRIRAAIASGGPGWNPLAYYLYGPSGREQLETWGLRAPDETPQRWRDFGFSPNAARVESALLLNVADREMISSLQPVADLERHGAAVEMYVFPDEYHIKWQPQHRLAIYARNIDWMDFWLRDAVNHDPVNEARNARWRTLRERARHVREVVDAGVSPGTSQR